MTPERQAPTFPSGFDAGTPGKDDREQPGSGPEHPIQASDDRESQARLRQTRRGGGSRPGAALRVRGRGAERLPRRNPLSRALRGVGRVVVRVTVKARRGTLVTALTREEFRLWENGEEQPIRYFSIDAFPLSAVILVDVGLTPSAHEAVQATLAVLSSAFPPAAAF